MSEAAIQPVHRLPWEGAADTSEDAATESLLSLASEEDEETTSGADGSAPGGDEPEGEVEPAEDAGEAESDDAQEPEEPSEEPENEPTYKVKVDGEEIEVPLKELLSGYSRQSDYTRKTQQLAQERHQLQAVQQQIRAVREQEAQRLAQVEEVLQSLTPPEPDWATLRREDPAEFAARWAEHQQRQQEIAFIQQQRVAREREIASSRQQELAGVLEQERQRLVEAIPAWKDAEKAAEGKRKLAEYAKGLGYTDADLAQVYDHRLMVILNKAAAYDALQTGKQKVVAKKVATPEPEVLRPGTRTAPTKASVKNGARAVERLNRTGRVADAAEAILNLDL